MNTRKIIIGGIGVAVLAAGIIGFKTLSGLEQKPPANGKSNGAVVQTMSIENGKVKSEKRITGRLMAHEKVELYAEVGGKAYYGSKPFKTGMSFKKGEILLRIDDSEFESALISSKSQFLATIAQVMPDIKIDFADNFEEWQSYLSKFDIKKPIPDLPKVKESKLKLFLSGRGVYTAYYKIKESETRLAKFIIRAPFDGSLTEAFLNEGTLVRVGQQLGEFMQTGTYDLEASVNNAIAKNLNIGMELEFTESLSQETYIGKLTRINDKLDQNTQLVKIYFLLKSKGLRSGMYLNADLSLTAFENAVKIPLPSLVDDSYVFLVEKGKAVKKEIEVLERGTEFVIVRGLPNMSKIIIDHKNSAFEGSEVLEMN